VTAQGRVAAGGEDFKNTFGQAQNRDVKSASTQIVNGVNAFAGIVESISNGCGSGLVDETQHFDARQLRGVFGGLALGVVKISWHRDDGAIKISAKSVFGAVAQGGQN